METILKHKKIKQLKGTQEKRTERRIKGPQENTGKYSYILGGGGSPQRQERQKNKN